MPKFAVYMEVKDTIRVVVEAETPVLTEDEDEEEDFSGVGC